MKIIKNQPNFKDKNSQNYNQKRNFSLKSRWFKTLAGTPASPTQVGPSSEPWSWTLFSQPKSPFTLSHQPNQLFTNNWHSQIQFANN